MQNEKISKCRLTKKGKILYTQLSSALARCLAYVPKTQKRLLLVDITKVALHEKSISLDAQDYIECSLSSCVANAMSSKSHFKGTLIYAQSPQFATMNPMIKHCVAKATEKYTKMRLNCLKSLQEYRLNTAGVSVADLDELIEFKAADYAIA